MRRAAVLQSQQTPLVASPLDAAEGWRAACALIERWGTHVEQRWRSLWIGNDHVDESKLQSSFETFAQGAELLDRVVFSEVDTGRGPVDFVFVNGLSVRVYVEFKRSDHARLVHGATTQLPTYMRAADAEAGILVCVSFDDADVKAVAEVRAAVDNSGSERFVNVIEVDARRKASASTV